MPSATTVRTYTLLANRDDLPTVSLKLWYDRQTRAWWGAYVDAEGDQLGPAWNSYNRDDVLIFRPDHPALHPPTLPV